MIFFIAGALVSAQFPDYRVLWLSLFLVGAIFQLFTGIIYKNRPMIFLEAFFIVNNTIGIIRALC